ncbi:MAG TPA: type 4a pilus biogenesis protein PilO [Nitrospiraceae bacterium]|nr:type 4a pilus biogenesis protein PilO [Nitrospiraceae bacterium]
MKLPAINLDLLRSIPLIQKVGLLLMVLAGIIVGFYYYVAEPKSAEIVALQGSIGTLDGEIQTLTIKVKHLDELIAANKQLEIELAKKKERLPPEEEAIMLLKQVSDLGIRLGLDIKLWKPSPKTEDPSKLFVRMPVNVEVSGGYHTAALFFDRINSMPRIVTVSGLKMGAPKFEKGRVVTQTVFDLVAYAAPEEIKLVAAASATPPIPQKK